MEHDFPKIVSVCSISVMNVFEIESEQDFRKKNTTKNRLHCSKTMQALFRTMLSGFVLGFGFGFRIGFRIQHQINSRIPDLGLDSIGFIIESGFAANHNGISRFTKSDWIS